MTIEEFLRTPIEELTFNNIEDFLDRLSVEEAVFMTVEEFRPIAEKIKNAYPGIPYFKDEFAICCWHDLLKDYTEKEVAAAVHEHISKCDEPITIAHIIEIADAGRRRFIARSRISGVM